jgi:hypothetical protein
MAIYVAGNISFSFLLSFYYFSIKNYSFTRRFKLAYILNLLVCNFMMANPNGIHFCWVVANKHLIFGCRLIDDDECLIWRSPYEKANMNRIFLY